MLRTFEKNNKEKIYLFVPCKKKEFRFLKCLNEYEYNIKFCEDLRREYETCITKYREKK